MENNLLPIYMLRMLLLEKGNPKYFAANKDLILRTSLAAQDYVLSGGYYEYDKRTMGLEFRNLPKYTQVHQKYKLPCNPDILVLSAYSIHPGLVMDLSWSFQQDKTRNIVDSKGNILDENKLSMSEVLQVYHNTSISSRPIISFRALNAAQQSELLAKIRQKTK